MPDALFADPRLAEIYDDLDGDRSDLDLYVALVDEFAARSVLDLGCGTGTFATRLALAGVDTTGVDPAEASLWVASGKPGADRVRWVCGDVESMRPLTVDLVTMTGNVAQVFTTDEAWTGTLRACRELLTSDGRLVFEVRDPDARAWEEWTPRRSRSITDTAHGPVESWVDVVRVALPLVSFRWTFRFLTEGSELTSVSTLRFRSREEIERSLTESGLAVAEVRDTPDRPGREYVFVAHRD